MTFTITSAFDSGNIDVLGIEGDIATLAICRDKDSDFYQWFHFRVAGARNREIVLKIINCGTSAYPLGWPGYQARFSDDRQDWQQAVTSYAEGVLTIVHKPALDTTWFAYHAPYSMERHHDLVSRIGNVPGVSLAALGQSLEGQPVDCLTLGTGPKSVWLYGRQHPGESMAEWWMEGALDLLVSSDPVSEKLREAATIHVVPNMNPDGSRRGHLRTNAKGVNLNREWATPTAGRSPEVLCVLQAMDATGVDFAMDIHGDESIPYVFLAGFHGIPSWTARQGQLYDRFAANLAVRTPDFQTEHGYPVAGVGKANLTMSTNQLAERFGAVSMTLEMPFKDNDGAPDPERGWSPERSRQLARDCLATLAEMIEETG